MSKWTRRIGVVSGLVLLALVDGPVTVGYTQTPLTVPTPTCTDDAAARTRTCTATVPVGVEIGTFEYSAEATALDGSKVTAGPATISRCGPLSVKIEGENLTFSWVCPGGTVVKFSVIRK